MITTPPLVSAIVISYNHEKFVAQSIESVLKQTYAHIDLMVVDNNSTDRSASIITALQKQHGFSFEQQSNAGLVATLNKYIPLCRGKYITMLASDDAWIPDKIEKQVKFMEENSDVAVCFGNSLSISEKNEIVPYYFQRFSQYAEYTFEDVISFNAHISSPTNMYRKEVFDKVGLYDPVFWIEDLYMHLKIAHSGYKLAVLPDLFTYYRIHGKNTSKRNKLMYKEKLKLLNLYKDEKGYREGVLKTHLHYYMHLILSILPSWLLPFKRV